MIFLVFSWLFHVTILHMFSHQEHNLANGLKVITIPLKSTRSITTLALVRAGSRYETEQEQGLAHLIEHLVFKGTKKYANQLQMAQALEQYGAESNAFTSKEYTGFYVTSVAEELRLSLEVINQLLFQPLLRSADMDDEKQVIAQEIDLLKDDPQSYIGLVFDQFVYKKNGLAHPVSGSIDKVQALTLSQVKKFMEKWYRLSNMILVLAGDEAVLSTSKPLDIVRGIFQEGEAFQEQIASLDFSQPDLWTQEKFKLINRDTAQAHFIMSWPAIRRDDAERYALSLLATILGGNRSSRLFEEIREKRHLAYYIWSDITQYEEGGTFGAEGALDKEKASEGLQAIKEQFELIASAQKPITEEELQRAKSYTKGRVLLGLEDSYSVARYYAFKQILLNEIEDPDEALAKYEAVTVEEINALAEKLIKPGEMRLAVIGPFADGKQFEGLF